MRDKRLSLRAKWLWRFGREDSSLWKKVLCAKYGLGLNLMLWNCLKVRTGFVSSKVEVFTWQLAKGRTLVREVLLRFGIAQMASSGCPQCEEGPESIDHVFLLCIWSIELWRTCIGWWGMSVCSPSSVKGWLLGWNVLCLSRSRKRVWNTLFFAVV
ncbi:hypothetical protein Dsin_005669 [Dipteronia sinensis]|uniref:Reverse transcriptase zinc-binding domain-containing protein n=1 Tax=Dipteronia sinensis TaxID=43782 RepID=A0AAE0AY94_9ROSI|nr:hypothetical protein Dsin_005669 [Dipteronia sinensis]